jgi:formylglycine-generating enzyme required for sulfatase activity
VTASSLSVREPAGARAVALPCTVGGAATDDLRIPDAGDATLFVLALEDGELGLRMTDALRGGAITVKDRLRVNGRLPTVDGFHALAAGDVLSVGGTRLIVRAAGARPALDVRHLAGNDTLPPLRPQEADSGGEDAAEARITAVAAEAMSVGGGRAGRDGYDVTDAASRAAAAARSRLRRGFIAAAALVAVLLGLAIWILKTVQPVTVSVTPAEATVRGSGFSWRSGDLLFLRAGPQVVTARAAGHRTVTRTVQVREGEALRLDLRLEPLPGVLEIDTGGVAAQVFIDGAEAGKAPGSIEAGAGERTLMLRAPRFLDAVRRVEVEGRGVRQPLRIEMRSNWGRLEATTTAVGAVMSIDGAAPVAMPISSDLPAGMHRLEVTAPGFRPWRSAVVVKAGETSRIGPIELGAPDMLLTVRSRPAGAEVTVGGSFRGRTPIEVALAPGVAHDIGLALQGYAPASASVAAAAGQRDVLDVVLQPVMVALTVQGEPAEAEVSVDGAVRGKTPLTLKLPARPYRVEVRRAGSEPQQFAVDLSAAVDRTLDYSLSPAGRPAGWKPAPATLTPAAGRTLRLLPPGSFVMGSDRREQGRRANESARRVTLSRPFYIAAREVTNGEFRRFRPGHASGYVDRRSIDLDGQAVTGVAWSDAVEYCNWLSAQEGLPPAYEQAGGGWVLRRPVTTGYRLPSEAEWEYAARQVPLAGRPRRYEWGDGLPPPSGSANLAGTEAAATLPRVLEGWQDEYPSVAPPGKHPANGLGLHDLTGNVSEWVHDAYASFDPSGGGTDPFGPASGARRVIKGSNWRTGAFTDLRPAWREGADGGSQDLGFRVARYAE